MNATTMMVLAIPTLVGCGGNALANPCATPNATYFEHCAEESGDCGAVPDQVVNVGPDGTIVSKVECATSTADGCIVRGSGCMVTSMGATTTTTYETTFAADGSSAMSIATLTVSVGAQSCTSTYSCTLTRQ